LVVLLNDSLVVQLIVYFIFDSDYAIVKFSYIVLVLTDLIGIIVQVVLLLPIQFFLALFLQYFGLCFMQLQIQLITWTSTFGFSTFQYILAINVDLHSMSINISNLFIV